MMEFILTRTSLWNDEKPHGDAIKKKLTYIDERTWKTLEEANQGSWGQDWLASGKNHREINSVVARDVEREAWVIGLDGLGGLLELLKSEGELIISESNYKEVPLRLEIYDDYRE